MAKRKRGLLPGYKDNFNTLSRAFDNGDVALMDCTDKKTKKAVAVICAVNRHDNGDYEFIPMAKLFAGNPYKEIDPPKEGE